ncbi:hypothetical protein Belba_1317 [Belliella baltica DSM 15883]|uniref:Uncharacterized protein n=1 Tax=Belliella baltica (strain DSM 15883 / CIP 108006 / LMG 21964 / BA134) TaxID=866536 RepID=I3Z3X4_BELBD|nr:hypothetical protein Belba_1317 [Belliella baltica DSM 15883]
MITTDTKYFSYNLKLNIFTINYIIMRQIKRFIMLIAYSGQSDPLSALQSDPPELSNFFGQE